MAIATTKKTAPKEGFAVSASSLDKDKDKERALQSALASIEKNHGKGSIMTLGQNSGKAEMGIIPTGCIQLDAILGILLEARREEGAVAEDLASALEGSALESARASLPRIFRLLRNSEFKRRQLPFSLKVSPWAFGRGRRIPLTAK